MKKQATLIDCPMCLYSSGYVPFVGSHSQKCSDCNGTGKISSSKLKELKALYKDLIN